MFLKVLLGIWMCAAIVAAFLFTSPATGGFMAPDAARIIFFHVPCAIVSVVAFLAAALYAYRFMRTRDLMDDAKSAASTEIGLLFAVFATLTGSIFARVQWGSWWNWDPRETSIAVLLLIYAAQLTLRSAVDDSIKRAKVSSAYTILAVPAMVFLVFAVPRLMVSLHPEDTLTTGGGLSTEYRIVLFSAIVGFLGIYVWIFRMKTALAALRFGRGR